MKLTDEAIVNLIKTCAAEGKDNYFALPPPKHNGISALSNALGSRILTLLPGTVYPCGVPGVTVLNAPEDVTQPHRSDAVFADIRLTGEPVFEEYILRQGPRVFLLPFYETALPAEYGYRFSYRQIAELRASLPFPIHVIGVSARNRTECVAEEAFGSQIYYVVDTPEARRLYGVKTLNEADTFRLIARQCEKTRFKRHILLCPTRTKAEHLHAFLHSWGIGAALFHGGRTKSENEAALFSFTGGQTDVLAATKALLPCYPFLEADALFYCGLPSSLSHADRCVSLSKTGELTCIWCADDIAVLQKQTREFAEALQITDPAFFEKRSADLNELLQYLSRNT